MIPRPSEAPAVSVLTTVRNRPVEVVRAIGSVLAQQFSDFEYLLLDDASTDDTPAVLERHAADPRMRVFRNDRQLGDYASRNRIAREARGRYLKYLDSDDLLHPFALEYMVSAMEAAPSAVFGLGGKPPRQWPLPVILQGAEALHLHCLGTSRILGGSGPTFAILRRDAFERAGGFPELRCIGDLALWLKLLELGDLLLLPGGLAHAARSERSETQTALYASPELYAARFRLQTEALRSPRCPIPADRRLPLIRTVRKLYAAELAQLGRRGARPPRFILRAARIEGIGPVQLIAAGLRRREPPPPVAPRPVVPRLRPVQVGDPFRPTLFLAGDPADPALADTLRSCLAQNLPARGIRIWNTSPGRPLPTDPVWTQPPVRVEPAPPSGAPGGPFCFLRAGDRLQPHALVLFAAALARFPAASAVLSPCESDRVPLPLELGADDWQPLDAEPGGPGLIARSIPAICVRGERPLDGAALAGADPARDADRWRELLAGARIVLVPGHLGFRPVAPVRRAAARGRPVPVRARGDALERWAEAHGAAAEPDWAVFPAAAPEPIRGLPTDRASVSLNP